ncbi:MAG TPA: hypothetical protein VGQ83_41495, partial [Polyangia bacterium]
MPARLGSLGSVLVIASWIGGCGSSPGNQIDGAAVDGAAIDGAVIDGAAIDGAVSDGAMADARPDHGVDAPRDAGAD